MFEDYDYDGFDDEVDLETGLIHYGILRKSGRYPWGSGENADTVAQRSKGFIDYLADMRRQGLSDAEIAKGLDMTLNDLRATNTLARAEKKAADISYAKRLKDKNYSNVAIGEKMGINESVVRSLLSADTKNKADSLRSTAEMLRQQVEDKGLVDVGAGVPNRLGLSKERLNASLATLKSEGYEVHRVKLPQVGNQHQTEYRVLAPPGTTQRDVFLRRFEIKQITDYTEDNGLTYSHTLPPLNVSSKRIKVNYDEDGGTAADGVIFVRPGKEDLSMGGAPYAQVRVSVDGTHYLKGMAVYKKDLPPGVDLVFNTNKKRSDVENDLAAMKKQQDDPENPFGAVVRQIGKRDANGRIQEVTSAMNIVNEAGDWQKWSKSLSSQVLSKQSPKLAEQLLGEAHAKRQEQFDEIMNLTNPAVRRKLLDTFASETDSAAVTLKAAHMPRQATHVILPVNSLKETEIYAPNYKDGERVALIRYPHGGTFEIPELTVNNRNREGIELLGKQAADAVGIHSKVAERLSGADFDGDTVLVIPQGRGKSLKSTPALEGLKGFDAKKTYPAYEGMKRMTPRETQIEMGRISNLITDMTLQGAGPQDLARAVRHSMVVIDAEKHNLNFRQSAIDNGITQLKQKYRGSGTAGASTIISKASSDKYVDERVLRKASDGGPIDPETGRLVYVPTGRTKVNKDGKVEMRKTKTTKLADTDDARTLVSKTKPTAMEYIYADHSNRMKALANEARREMVATKNLPYSPSANKAYKNEVATLKAKLNDAFKNRPLERQAQIIANAQIQAKRRANPDMDRDDIKKLQSRELAAARVRMGAAKKPFHITDIEWEAIQSGAVTNNMLGDILTYADLDRVKELATPRIQPKMSSQKEARAKQMAALGRTQAEIADALGVSVSTIKRTLS